MIDFGPGEVAVYYATRAPGLKQTEARKWRGPCPIHGGHRNNFAVDAENGRWFCFSACGRGGDLIALEMSLTGVGFTVAKQAVFSLIGRGYSSRYKRTRPGKGRKADELKCVRRWRSASIILADELLDRMEPNDSSRNPVTVFAAFLRKSSDAMILEELRLWRALFPEFTDAIIRAGYEHERRLQLRVAAFILGGEDPCRTA